MSWYVGPFAAEQRAFNEALLHFADELSARNHELRAALTRETDKRLSAEAELMGIRFAAPSLTEVYNRYFEEQRESEGRRWPAAYWYAIGRDHALERELAMDIRRRAQ